jgi:hypothetical protein
LRDTKAGLLVEAKDATRTPGTAYSIREATVCSPAVTVCELTLVPAGRVMTASIGAPEPPFPNLAAMV